MTTTATFGPTRMLLASDGSTTLLLEALLGCRLTVHVDAQRPVAAEQLPAQVRSGLGVRPGGSAVRRTSALHTPDHTVVSMNTVFFVAPPASWSGSATDYQPLGHRLREGRARQHREILSGGTRRWPGDASRTPCAYKEYVISCDDDSRIYVLEHFNPSYVEPPLG